MSEEFKAPEVSSGDVKGDPSRIALPDWDATDKHIMGGMEKNDPAAPDVETGEMDHLKVPMPEDRKVPDEPKEEESEVEEPVAETEEDDSSEQAEELPPIDQSLIATGINLGVSPAELQAYYKQNGAEATQQALWARKQDLEAQQSQSSPTDTKGETKKEIDELLSEVLSEGEDYGEELDPRVKKMAEVLSSHFTKKIDEIQGGVYRAQSTARDAQIGQAMDARISALGEPYEDVFGKGSYADQPQYSAQQNNRLQVIQTRIALQRAKDMGALSTVSEDGLDRMAAALVVGDKPVDIARKDINGKVKERAKSKIGKPSTKAASASRDPREMTNAERNEQARKRFAEKMAL